MERKIAGLVGAIAALTTVGAANAASPVQTTPSNVLRVSTFAELLEPIPNASDLLQEIDAAAPAVYQGYIEKVQYSHHHHHHHHSQYRRYVPRIVVVPPRIRRYHHHHHHHHHHHSFYRRNY